MLKSLTLFAILVSVIYAASDADWAVFKAKHGKMYHKREDYFRRIVFEDNLKKIQNHNDRYAKGLTSFYLGVNQYADKTNEEFVKMMNDYLSNGIRHPTNQGYKTLNVSLPSEINWVKKGYVTEVKNQSLCRSCWAFSATGSIEGAHFKATGKLVSLSESNLVDCSKKFGNKGCLGGLPDYAFKYIIANKGIDTEQSYPYLPENRPTCDYNPDHIGATISSYKDVESGSELHLQQASATVGPVSVAIDSSHLSFRFYKGGVYDEPQCSSTRLDHAVLVVGYGSDQGKDYWLVKNSWGTDWGEKGYIRMSRNKQNQCGIATSASYPIV